MQAAREPGPGRRLPAAARAGLSGADAAGLLLTAEMSGIPLDLLAAALGVPPRRAADLAARWAARRLAAAARLGPGPRWVWLTRAGLTACGLPWTPTPPALSRLAHLRAVTAVRIALESVPGYRDAGARWRSERRLRAGLGGRLGLRDHLPDGEVHWPEDGAGPGSPAPPRAAPPWAGECWAIEAELTPKTVSRTTSIMAEILSRTGDYGGPAALARVPGAPPRHARVVYVCSAAALSTVQRARDALGPDRARVEIRALPPSGYLPGPGRRG